MYLEPESDTPYADPADPADLDALDTVRLPVYDDQAELYAAAVTLYEMATGARTVREDGASDPRMLDDASPLIAEELFDAGPARRAGRALPPRAAPRRGRSV